MDLKFNRRFYISMGGILNIYGVVDDEYEGESILIKDKYLKVL